MNNFEGKQKMRKTIYDKHVKPRKPFKFNGDVLIADGGYLAIAFAPMYIGPLIAIKHNLGANIYSLT